MEFNIVKITGKMDLLNQLIDCKMNSAQYMNNEKILTKFTTLVDDLDTKTIGHALVGIENEYKTNIILIVINEKSSYTLYYWVKPEKIEKPLSFNIYDENYNQDIKELINSAQKQTNLSSSEAISLMLTQNLTGYSLNFNKIKEYLEFSIAGKEESSKFEKSETIKELIELNTHFVKNINDIKDDVQEKINAFDKKLNCDNLKIKVDFSGMSASEICIGKITEVRQMENKRHYKVEYVRSKNNGDTTKVITLTSGSITDSCTPTQYGRLPVVKLGENYLSTCHRTYNQNEHTFDIDNFKSIPYNFIDEGRYLIGIKMHDSIRWEVIISGDPKVDDNYVDTLKSVFSRYSNYSLTSKLTFYNTIIDDADYIDKFEYQHYENKVKSELSTEEIKEKGIRVYFQAIQKMVNEYKYLTKKYSAVGKDVLITDKISYNHEKGSISYGDFAIACDDEMMKSNMYEMFEQYTIAYYRNEITEETILNNLTNKFFSSLKSRISSVYGSNFTTTILINNVVNVKLTTTVTNKGANLTYLNDIRFNKNEIIVILKELLCYRNNEEASRFITNIGKIGLSVYIGITTGYEIQTYQTDKGNKARIFRFKKEKGRSDYTLLLDDTEIKIKGKKLISSLYSQFIDQAPYLSTKIEKIVFECVNNTLDYLKFKFLIDSAYESFKEKSKQFLDKKVKDLDGEYCTYLPENKRKPLEAIKITGISGKTYCIAYDNKDSFVFIDPQMKEGDTHYSNGKYICMVDQSNIKSNIGYDTVISKMMSLKNDSLIAGTIYNLEEELSDE